MVTFVTITQNIYSQEYKCGTDFSRFLSDPAVKEIYEKENEFARKYAKEVFKPNEKGTTYQIPIVFHVIHEYGYENQPDSEILEALEHMNNRWRKRLADSADVAYPFNLIHDDMEVEFILATKDPDGNASTGITRHVSELTGQGGGDEAGAVIRALYTWPPDQYLNVFICRSVGEGVGGYSQYPSGAASGGIDGIMVRRIQLSALAHEAGHYFNLAHLWGDSNSANCDGSATSNCIVPGTGPGTNIPAEYWDNCVEDDHVDDTPVCLGSAGFCNLSRKTCLSDSVPFYAMDGITVLATSQIIDNEQNVMDYAFCEDLDFPSNNVGENFTQGQKARVHAALNSSVASRNNLHTPSNLTLTGTDGNPTGNPIPIVDFQIEYEYVPTNLDAKFLNNTYNSNESITYSWDFDVNSSSTSTTAEEPKASWTETGKYDITLEASNSSGSSSLTQSIAKVLNGESIDPFTESFESIGFPSNGNDPLSTWFLDGLTNDETWKKTTEASTDGHASIMLDLKNTSGTHRFISPMVDLTQISCDTLYFDVAYAHRTSNSSESLRIRYSKNGYAWGASNTLFEKEGSDIDNYTALLTGDFIPSENDWRTHKVYIGNLKGEDGVLFMFEFDVSSGNRIYIDNVNFGCNSRSLVGENELISNTINFNIYPNPTNNDANISFSSNDDENTIFISDVTGKLIASKEYKNSNKTRTTVSEITGTNLNKGVYFVTVKNQSSTKTEKLIIK